MKGLRDHLRRCWLIYLLGAVGVFFLNNLVYTVTRPRVPESEILNMVFVDAEAAPAQLEWLEGTPFRELAVEYLSLDGSVIVDRLLTTLLIEGKADLFVTAREGFDRIANWGGCADLSGVALDGFSPVECPGLDGAAPYVGALGRDETYLIVPLSGADNEKTIAALPAIAEGLFK